MKYFLFILILLTTSCSTSKARMIPKQKGINKEFNSYIESYRHIIGKDKYQEKFDRLHVNFAKKKNPRVVGTCYWLANGELEIEINVDWWRNNLYYPLEREFVIYHELEHCIRNRMHTDKKTRIRNFSDFIEELMYFLGLIKKYDYLKDGCPYSIMHSTTMDFFCRRKHYNHYIEEIRNYGN